MFGIYVPSWKHLVCLEYTASVALASFSLDLLLYTDVACLHALVAAQNIINIACNVPLRDRSKQYIALSLAMGITDSFTVIARLVFKRRNNLSLDTDDWLTGSLLVTSAATMVIFLCNPIEFAWNRWDGQHQG